MARSKPKRLVLERLEERQVLTAFGVPWPEAGHLTLSFAPDGTAAGSYPSGLFATLDSEMPRRQWEGDILRAFQTWAVQANINIGLVGDSGQPFGILGLKQDDPRFGDVRIGAYPMSSDVLAVANPYDPFVANTWVGDVFLNSIYNFGGSVANSKYDLYSVALHEAGHVFGLGHSSDPNSPMFEQFHAGASLTSADVANLQALYGVRQADQLEGPVGNNTLATAAPLGFGSPDNGNESITAAADISSLADVDTYRFVAPQGSQTLNIGVQVAELSLLTARAKVLDASGNILSTAVTTDPLNNNLSISLDQVKPGSAYYVQISSGRSDAFGIGSYVLHVDSLGHNAADSYSDDGTPSNGGTLIPGAPPGYVGQNYTGQNNLKLLATTPGYVEHTYYELYDTVSPAVATRTYQVQSADVGPDINNVMTVVLNYSVDSNLWYKVSVRDDQGNKVAAKTIVNAAGHFELQVMGVQSAKNYVVKVHSYDAPADGTTFELRVDFAHDAGHLQTYVNDSLSPGQNSASRMLQVNESQQFHFVLGASDFSTPTDTGVRMTIVGPDGQLVYTMSAADGAVRSGDIFLDHGLYTVKFTRANEDSDVPVIFELSGLTTSEALGPQLRDTTQEPVESANPSAISQLSFYWLPNNPAPAVVVSSSNESQVPAVGQSSGGATSSSTLARDSLPGVLQQAPSATTTVVVARPYNSDGGLVAAAISQPDASEKAPRPSRTPTTADVREKFWRQLAQFTLAGNAISPVGAATSAVADGRPMVDEALLITPSFIAGIERLTDELFATFQNADSADFANLAMASICAALAWNTFGNDTNEEFSQGSRVLPRLQTSPS